MLTLDKMGDQFRGASQSSDTFTISDSSQSFAMAAAAIAGMQRDVWPMRTKLER
jgi:hypothetical protein